MYHEKVKLRRVFFVLVVILVAFYGYKVAHASYADLSPQNQKTISVPASAVDLPWPDYGQAAIGAVGYGVLATHGDTNSSLATASTAKIVTALCVLSVHPLSSGQQGPTITITQRDMDIYNKYLAENGSLALVALGEKLTEYQALQALLLPSGNNIADTLAIWAFGSVDNYVSYANNYVEHLGMKHTHISDASGFSSKTVSTAHDLVLLGEAAMRDPVLADVVSQRLATIPVAGVVYNYNTLLGHHGVIGIKTGNNDTDKGAYLYAATVTLAPGKTVTVVGATMGAGSLAEAMDDSVPLIDASQNDFSVHTLVKAGDVVGSYKVPWNSKTVNAVAARDLTVTTWNGTAFAAKTTLGKLTVPTATGTTVGSVKVTSAQGTAVSVPVILKDSIQTPPLSWRLAHP